MSKVMCKYIVLFIFFCSTFESAAQYENKPDLLKELGVSEMHLYKFGTIQPKDTLIESIHFFNKKGFIIRSDYPDTIVLVSKRQVRDNANRVIEENTFFNDTLRFTSSYRYEIDTIGKTIFTKSFYAEDDEIYSKSKYSIEAKLLWNNVYYDKKLIHKYRYNPSTKISTKTQGLNSKFQSKSVLKKNESKITTKKIKTEVGFIETTKEIFIDNTPRYFVDEMVKVKKGNVLTTKNFYLINGLIYRKELYFNGILLGGKIFKYNY